MRLSGFRIQGPHWGSEEGDDNLERGIFIDDWIYSISSVAVRVNAIDNLSAVATVLLPSSQPTPVPLPVPEPGPS